MKKYNIIKFYEIVVYNFKKKMNNDDKKLLNEQVDYSYEIAKIVSKLVSNIKLDNIPDNMDKYLMKEDNYYILNNYGILLGVLCALFHNIGYFIQIQKYHEINDEIRDNQELGLFYLMESKILKDFSIEAQIVLYEVVHNHNRDSLSYVDECSKFYVDLIKEAKIIYKNSNKLIKK